MGVKVATTCFQLSQRVIPHTSASTTASSPPKRRRSDQTALFCRHAGKLDQSPLLRTRSFDPSPKLKSRPITRVCSASLDAYSDEEFSKKIEELALRFKFFDTCDDNSAKTSPESDLVRSNYEEDAATSGFEEENDCDFASPLMSKLKWEDDFREAGESTYCSVKKAFSSMVFIIRELHSYTLQIRELLFTENLRGILGRVQEEMHASFVWLFQQVFSHTPTLMVYVMILLANFTVHSMASNAAIAATTGCFPVAAEGISVAENLDEKDPNFGSSSVNSFSATSSTNRFTSIGGNNGGGNKTPPMGSGTDGDGSFNLSDQFRTIVPDEARSVPSLGRTREVESVSPRDEELRLWNSMEEEATKMRDESLDSEARRRLVSPITAKIEADDYEDYSRTDLVYKSGLAEDPDNPLLLANYAQFLYLVAHDYGRAEEYFKRAIKIKEEATDAEAYSKYANFLWRAKNDLWAAEEAFLEAISADPTNSYYAANYAHFLWNTGGEDTCFPLSSSDSGQEL